MSKAYPRLVGDIGGTHARLAWQTAPGAPLEGCAHYACDAHPDLESVLEAHVAASGLGRPVALGLGVATPVQGDRVSFTNLDWSFSIAELKQRLGVSYCRVLNDFEAVAWALPALSANDVRAIGGGQAKPGAPRVVLGPGTGLGVASLLTLPERHGGGHVPVTGEGGHVTLAARTDLEEQVLRVMRHRFGHVSAERALSGPGLVNLHQAWCEVQGVPCAPLTPAEITDRALRPDAATAHPDCAGALQLFCEFLGTVAADLALTLGAHGGVLIAGGIVPRLGEAFDRSGFRARFEDKGRFSAYLRRIPTSLIVADNPGLLGAARALDAWA